MDPTNSIPTRDILRNFTYTGTMKDVGNSPEININITCDTVSTLNTIQVFINYSNDLVNIKSESYTIGNLTQYNIRSRPLSKYFSVSLINGLNNIIKFNMETSLRVAIGYTNQDVVTIDGSVSVSNFPATQEVSGTVAVTGAYQSIQPVSGTVTTRHNN